MAHRTPEELEALITAIAETGTIQGITKEYIAGVLRDVRDSPQLPIRLPSGDTVAASSLLDIHTRDVPRVDPRAWGIDTTSTVSAQTAAFQAAIDYIAATYDTGIVVVPRTVTGDWSVSQLTLRKGVTLQAEGRALHGAEWQARQTGRLVHAPVSAGQHMIVAETPPVSDYVWGMGIVGIVCVPSADSGDAIHLSLPGRTTIKDVVVDGGYVDGTLTYQFESGIVVDGSIYTQISDCNVNYCSNAACEVANDATSSTTTTISGGTLRSSPNLFRGGGVGIILSGVTFESNTAAGTGDRACNITGGDVELRACYAENIQDGFALVANGTSRFTIHGGVFCGPNGGVATGEVFLELGTVSNYSVVGARVSRFDKVVKTTADTGAGTWQSYIVQVGSAPWSELAKPARLAGSWQYETGTVGSLSAEKLVLRDNYGTQLRISPNMPSVREN